LDIALHIATKSDIRYQLSPSTTNTPVFREQSTKDKKALQGNKEYFEHHGNA